MVVFNLLLYDLRVKLRKRHVIAFTLSLVVAIVVDATRGGDNHVRRQGARCHAGGDGDHVGTLEMEINDGKEEKAIPCHIILACDVYPFIMHLILLRTAVAL
jgi:hypothetical protein